MVNRGIIFVDVRSPLGPVSELISQSTNTAVVSVMEKRAYPHTSPLIFKIFVFHWAVLALSLIFCSAEKLDVLVYFGRPPNR